MGRFVAYLEESGAPAKELEGGNTSYYHFILQKAFGSAFTSQNGSPNGHIQKDGHRITSGDAALRLIAEVESNYIYKWEDDSKPQDILNQLKRVDVFLAKAIYSYSVKKQIENQDSELKLSDSPFRLDEVGGVLSVTFDEKAMPLYLDTNEEMDTNKETANYKYRKDLENNSRYGRVRTWIPWDTPGPKNEVFYSRYDKYHSTGSKPDLLRRYRYYLYQELLPEGLDEKKLDHFAGLGDGDPLERIKSFLKKPVKSKIEKAAKRADDLARRIFGNYRCFYYSVNEPGEIDGFLTNFGEDSEGPGFGGYGMRADKVSEMDYQWAIIPDPVLQKDDYWMAKVLSQIIGLDKVPPGSDGLFSPTNFPHAQEDKRDAMKVVDQALPPSVSLFEYYKNLKEPAPKHRKNKPYEEPKKPRTRLQGPGRTMEGVMFRKWKKGLSLAGEPVGRGDRSTRAHAAMVMGDALNKFEFYSKAMDGDDTIARLRLPATSFANFVVHRESKTKANDKTAADAWKEWTSGDSVRTDQEWCHLYGHGDGGTEVLDNFISGSKHCNTEQLAIETGQRRVTQNDDLKPQRDHFTWKITAHEIPNEGTVVNSSNLPSSIEKYLKGLPPEDTALFFLKDPKTEERTLKNLQELREGFDELAARIKKLQDSLREKARNNQKVEEGDIELLRNRVAFQRALQTDCFLYYPLGQRIHYRIFYKGKKGLKKCFEHYFDAQSESFDVNEAKILDYTVERALYLELEEQKEEINKQPAIEYYKDLLRARAGIPESAEQEVKEKEAEGEAEHANQQRILRKDASVKGLVDWDDEDDKSDERELRKLRNQKMKAVSASSAVHNLRATAGRKRRADWEPKYPGPAKKRARPNQ